MQEKSLLERHHPTIGYAIGSCIAEITTLPIFAIKTNYQTSSNKSVKTIIKNIYSQYGIFGFYNAVFSAIFARITSSFIKYFMYNEIKYYRQTNDDELFNNMMNGCLAGILCSFFVHPIDVITNHLQRFKKFDMKLFHYKVLYAGFSQTLLRNFILYSVLFSLFDYCKYLTNNNIVFACIMTTTVSTSILQPVDYLRTRLMAQQKNEMGNIFKVIKNFKSCWKGYHLNYIANTMHFTIAMCFAGYFSSLLKKI
jgi:hypothetical protein